MTAPGSPGLRVVLVDDVEDLRVLLTALLAQYPGIEVVGEAADGVEAIAVVEATQPDLVVLDITMPVMDGVTALPELRRVAPDARVVVLSAIPEASEPGAMRAGATAYVEKSAGSTHLLVPDILAGAGLLDALLPIAAGEQSRRYDQELPSDLTSAGRARQFARHALGGQADQLLDTVQLLLSEMVTNAVVHAQSAPAVAIAVHHDRVHVEVTDTSSKSVAPRQADDAAESGRGMAIIDALADAWGTTLLPGGKVVWFDVARSGPADGREPQASRSV